MRVPVDLEKVRTMHPEDRAEVLAYANELALRSLAWFVRLRFFWERRIIVWAPYLDILCETAERVTVRELRRTMVNMPPRALKSETLSQCWQAWMIAREDSPRSSLVSASYAMSLAERDAIKTREIMRAPWFAELCPRPLTFRRDTQASWETSGGATRTAAGSDGPILGKGADHLLGDDLLKAKEANSELVREGVNDWFGETLRTRLNDPATGTITLIAQRLHERDICGFLLQKQANPDADQWTHINLPLIAEQRIVYSFGDGSTWARSIGDCLNPPRWPAQEVRALRVMLGPNFEGQYQQRPTKQEGGMLRPAKLMRANATAQAIAKRWGLRPNLYLDLATKEKQTVKDDPDWSVIAIMARDQLDRVWILDLWRDRVPMDVTARMLVEMIGRWSPGSSAGEKIGLHHAFKAVLQLTCRLRKKPVPYLRDVSIGGAGDKVQKAGAFAGLLNMGMIGVPAGAPWLADLESEMRTFPLGNHDDQVDTIALGCHDLQAMAEGEAPPAHSRLDPAQVDGRMIELARKRAKQLAGEDGPEDTWD